MSQYSLFDLPVRGRRSNQVIEAGAGTGKTTRIVRDVILYLLADAQRDASRLVLMTFTEKAAAEIAARIRSGLIELRDLLETGQREWPDRSHPVIVVPATDAPSFLAAARLHCTRLDTIRSQTIHSFCQSLLRTWPLEAGIDPGFTLVEGYERERLLDDAFSKWVAAEMDAGSPYHEEWELVLRHTNSLDRVRKNLVSLIPRRDLLADPAFSLGTLDELYTQLEGHIATLAEVDGEAPARRSKSHLDAMLRITREMAGTAITESNWEILHEVFRGLRSGFTLTDLPKESREAWRTIREIVDGDLVGKHRAAEAQRKMALRFFSALDSTKAASGALDFDDLLEATDRLLADGTRIDEIRSRFDAFFVDEFQDTDRVQARILDRLARDASGSLMPGRVTIVGDPKQSIYSFRRAEPEVFHFTLDAYRSEGAVLDVLDTQYRSDPPLVEAVNSIFAVVFANGKQCGPVRQPAYTPLAAGRRTIRRELPARLRFLAAEVGIADDPARAEAEAVAEWIALARDPREKGPDGDLRRFAILLRKLTRAAVWADVFERRGIDLEMPPSTDLLSQRGSVDLISVLQAIADSSDRAALFSAARSAFFAIPDDLIVRGIMGGGPSPEWEDLTSSISRWRKIATARGAGATIDAISADRRIDVTLGLTRGGDRWLGRIEHLRGRAAEFDHAGRGSLRAFLRELTRRREEGGEVELIPNDEGRNSVRLMSVHAAKGLEFDTVILPELGSATQRGGVDAFTIGESLVMQSPDSINRVTRTVGSESLKRVQALRAEWERDRLFYVAVTRARCEVVFALPVDSPESLASGIRRRTPLRRRSEFWKPLSDVFRRDPKDFDSLIPESYEAQIIETAVGDRLLPVAFERAPRPTGGDSPLRFIPGFEPGTITPEEPQAPTPPPSRLEPADIARATASAARRSSGVAIHRILELWDGTSPLETLVRDVANEHRLDDLERERIRRDLARVGGSKGWRFIREGAVVARELSLVVRSEGVVREIRLDLLLRNAEGKLIVVDYKTGAWSDERAAVDAAQVQEYCNAVEAMTGEACAGMIWYIGDDRVVNVDPLVSPDHS